MIEKDFMNIRWVCSYFRNKIKFCILIAWRQIDVLSQCILFCFIVHSILFINLIIYISFEYDSSLFLFIYSFSFYLSFYAIK